MSVPHPPQANSILCRITGLFRFRLLTLLVAVTLICAWLAWRFHRVPISPENVSALQRIDEITCPSIYKLIYSPDRSRVAFVGWEKPVEVREAITLWPVRTIGYNRKLIDFAFSPDQRHVACTENSTRAEILTLGSDQRLILETGNFQPDVAFSPDGKLLATGGYGTEAKLWDAKTGKLVGRLDCGSTEGGLTPVFSPDGRKVAVGNRNSNTVLFDVATGNRLLVLPKRMTQELTFHPSGRTLAIAYVDGNVGLWDANTGNLIAEQDTAAAEIYTLDWSPDGELLASAGLEGGICVWDNRLRLLQSLPAPEWVISAKFSPDGTRLMTAGGSSTARDRRSVMIWGVRTSPLEFLGY